MRTSIYLVTFKNPEVKKIFSSMTAIFSHYTSEELGVSYSHLKDKISAQGYHETKVAFIEKLPINYKKKDI